MSPSCTVFPESIPQKLREAPRMSAEVRMYDALGTQLGYGWTVIYDVAWLGAKSVEDGARDGQVDFVVAHPKKGVLLIEVKGGRIRFDGTQRQWFSMDREGVSHEIDPVAQVRRSKFSLLAKLQMVPSLRHKWIELSHAVCFPHSARPSNAVTPDCPPEIIIGADDFDRLPTRIEEILKYWHGNKVFEHGDIIVREMTRLLAQSVELRTPLGVQALDEQQTIIQLTESQLRALSYIRKVRRAVISGAAGSGKTFLAIEKTKQLAAEGFSTLLVCHSSLLAQFLKTLIEDHQNIEVMTIHELARTRMAAANLPPAADVTLLPTLLFEAMTRLRDHTYDAIIVDEGQDMTTEWWLALESCLKEGRESVFYAFQDSHQSLMGGSATLPDDMIELMLEDNVRNTQNICEAIRHHYHGQIAIVPRGPAGRPAEQIAYSGQGELAKALGGVLVRLLTTERFRNTDLIVLTPRSLEQSALPSLKVPGSIELVPHFPAAKGRQIQFASVAEFKGLERKVVVVAELDDALPSEPERRNAMCYVAFSRPRHHLVLLGNHDVLASLLPDTH